jgi:hypothetical protein
MLAPLCSIHWPFSAVDAAQALTRGACQRAGYDKGMTREAPVKERLAAAIALLCLAPELSRASQGSFPSNQPELVSPSGHMSIVWHEATVAAPHRLSLRIRNNSELPIVTFGRHASVAWSPDNRAFAVSLSDESNSSHMVVYAISAQGELRALHLVYPAEVSSALLKSDHSYVELRAWNEKGLQLHAWGYLPESFSRNLACSKDGDANLTCRSS